MWIVWGFFFVCFFFLNLFPITHDVGVRKFVQRAVRFCASVCNNTLGYSLSVHNNVDKLEIFLTSLRLSVHLEGRQQQQQQLLPGPSGLRKGQWAMSKGVQLQHQVPDDEAVRGGEGEQLQCGHRSRGAGRVPQRDRCHEAEPPVQLQV